MWREHIEKGEREKANKKTKKKRRAGTQRGGEEKRIIGEVVHDINNDETSTENG